MLPCRLPSPSQSQGRWYPSRDTETLEMLLFSGPLEKIQCPFSPGLCVATVVPEETMSVSGMELWAGDRDRVKAGK